MGRIIVQGQPRVCKNPSQCIFFRKAWQVGGGSFIPAIKIEYIEFKNVPSSQQFSGWLSVIKHSTPGRWPYHFARKPVGINFAIGVPPGYCR
jgi:hypothetical protein